MAGQLDSCTPLTSAKYTRLKVGVISVRGKHVRCKYVHTAREEKLTRASAALKAAEN